MEPLNYTMIIQRNLRQIASHGATFFGTSFHGDNIVSAFGDSSDLQLFHNGTDSFIKDVGTGGS
ncbi:MAG: hypothetical protein CM15mP10_0210 [Actinomycetota bacterium]|nr:MAG: hypothetical protein CM15mP10_0210 [Actinomycetota bacterium]